MEIGEECQQGRVEVARSRRSKAQSRHHEVGPEEGGREALQDDQRNGGSDKRAKETVKESGLSFRMWSHLNL